jgi:hypothetical protein
MVITGQKMNSKNISKSITLLLLLGSAWVQAQNKIPAEIAAKLPSDEATGEYQEYLRASDHKAFASAKTAIGWVFNRASVEEAKQEALQVCSSYLAADGAPCEVISVDGQ